jgi:hypothetical protein
MENLRHAALGIDGGVCVHRCRHSEKFYFRVFCEAVNLNSVNEIPEFVAVSRDSFRFSHFFAVWFSFTRMA